MRILFLTRSAWPNIGGVEKHIKEIKRELEKRGHKIIIVDENSINQTKKFEYSNKLKKLKIWWWLWKNRALIKKADIVHAHDVGFWYFPFRFFYLQKPFYITFHGWEGQYPIPIKNKIIRKISEKLAWGNICVGDYIKKWYGTQPDFITYGGVEKKRVGKIKKGKEIIFIGRLTRDTGLPIYLKACKILNTKYQILFLGDGQLRKKAERYGKVLGFISHVKPYILKSRFVFTSGYLSILEAMICKKLVFAVYDNPLKKDYLTMTPFRRWIIIENNPKRLAKKLNYYFHHPSVEKELVNQAYLWAKKQSWKRLAELYLKLWQIK